MTYLHRKTTQCSARRHFEHRKALVRDSMLGCGGYGSVSERQAHQGMFVGEILIATLTTDDPRSSSTGESPK